MSKRKKPPTPKNKKNQKKDLPTNVVDFAAYKETRSSEKLFCEELGLSDDDFALLLSSFILTQGGDHANDEESASTLEPYFVLLDDIEDLDDDWV